MIADAADRWIRQLVTATPDYFALHGIPETPDDLLSHQGIGMRIAHGGIYRWDWPVGETYAPPCRRAATSIFCLDPRAVKAGLGGIFTGTLCSGRALKAGSW